MGEPRSQSETQCHKTRCMAPEEWHPGLASSHCNCLHTIAHTQTLEYTPEHIHTCTHRHILHRCKHVGTLAQPWRSCTMFLTLLFRKLLPVRLSLDSRYLQELLQVARLKLRDLSFCQHSSRSTPTWNFSQSSYFVFMTICYPVSWPNFFFWKISPS